MIGASCWALPGAATAAFDGADADGNDSSGWPPRPTITAAINTTTAKTAPTARCRGATGKDQPLLASPPESESPAPSLAGLVPDFVPASSSSRG
ncbi:hypothetical protein B7435_07230 [Mycolicibacterium peregrinum]|nr:hypothetical protein B7435_07230 [Mycolicibacterium peregrinum]